MDRIQLTETDLLLLRAQTECSSQKSVVTLRYALLWSGRWNEDIEYALCNRGDEEPLVAEYYRGLCRLACETPFADGAGDLSSPAGPRYTECWITPAGTQRLAQAAPEDR